MAEDYVNQHFWKKLQLLSHGVMVMQGEGIANRIKYKGSEEVNNNTVIVSFLLQSLCSLVV